MKSRISGYLSSKQQIALEMQQTQQIIKALEKEGLAAEIHGQIISIKGSPFAYWRTAQRTHTNKGVRWVEIDDSLRATDGKSWRLPEELKDFVDHVKKQVKEKKASKIATAIDILELRLVALKGK